MSDSLDQRLRRAFRADSWAPPEGLLAALARRPLPAARAAYAQVAVAAGRSNSQVVLLESYLRGECDDRWLSLARAGGVALADLFGSHELAIHVVRRTVARCLADDFPAGGSPEVAEVADAVCRALDLPALQNAWLGHRSPGSIQHFARLANGADLRAARLAYLRCAEGAGLPRARSRVGWVEIVLHGSPDEKGGLVDWDRLASCPQGDGGEPLPLVCGVFLDPSHEAPTAATFSVLELLARDRAPLAVTALEPGGDRDPPAPAEELGWLPAGDSVVDRILLLVGQACGVTPPWLPAMPVPAPPPALSPERLAELSIRLAGAPVVLALGRGCEARPEELDALLRTARSCAGASAPIAAGVAAADALIHGTADECASAWRTVLDALLRWRVATCLDALRARRPSTPTLFRHLAEAWLGYVPFDDPPRGRTRTPGRERADDADAVNRFQYDPAGSADDQRMTRIAWSGAYDQGALAAWLVNEWSWGARLLELTGEAAVRALAPHLAPGRKLGAFKKAVTVEGYVFWSLAELDRALEVGRARWGQRVDRRSWRLSHRRRLDVIPRRAWAADWPPTDHGSRSEALAQLLAGRVRP